MTINGLSRAGLARWLGVSRAWVTKALRSPHALADTLSVGRVAGPVQNAMVSDTSSNPSSCSTGNDGVS